ncbi:MAG: flavin reductase family protein [Bacillota bacterium]
MKKITRSPSTVLFPAPVVLVTSAALDGRPNVFTVAWTATVNSIPPMISISARPATYSHGLIKQSGEFVVNIPNVKLVWEVDYCGMVSGRDVDKFAATGLTPMPAKHVRAPLIEECPVNIECRVTQTLKPGGHEMFLGEILAVHFNEDAVDEKGQPDIDRISPYAYCASGYRLIGEKIGHYGFSKKQPRNGT